MFFVDGVVAGGAGCSLWGEWFLGWRGFCAGFLFLFGRDCWDLFWFYGGRGLVFGVSLFGGNVRPVGCLAEQVAEHAVPQFGFKPRAFWRQDAVLIGNGYQVGDAEGMEGEGDAVWGFVR